MSVLFLDTALDQAADKILLHYSNTEFCIPLNEAYLLVLRQMVVDGIKVGIALQDLANRNKEE